MTVSKGSDKKKFRQNVKKVFFDNSDESDCLLDAFLPQKEEMTMSKVYTFGGESVLIYTVGKDPLFFELDKAKTLFPTGKLDEEKRTDWYSIIIYATFIFKG